MSQALGFVQVPNPNNNEQFQTIRYDQFVQRLFKGEARKNMLVHAALGIMTEAAECSDPIKAHWVYGRELDRENIIEELGDLRFYMQALQNLLNVTEQEVLQANAIKLSKRYVNLTYIAEHAIARLDKQEPNNSSEHP